mgnify:FL=1
MSLIFNSSAAKKVREIMEEDSNIPDDISLRVSIRGGGCSGFQYGFTFDGKQDGDEAVVTDGVTLLVDPTSLQYLDGAEINYSADHFASQFTITNPNAQTTCGCGSSFAV